MLSTRTYTEGIMKYTIYRIRRSSHSLYCQPIAIIKPMRNCSYTPTSSSIDPLRGGNMPHSLPHLPPREFLPCSPLVCEFHPFVAVQPSPQISFQAAFPSELLSSHSLSTTLIYCSRLSFIARSLYPVSFRLQQILL